MSVVVVVGAGIIGLSCAYELTKAGHKVTVLDERAPEAARCSDGNAGYLVPSHFVPLAAAGMIHTGLKMAWRPESPFGIAMPPKPETLAWMARFASFANKRHEKESELLIRDLSLRSKQIYSTWASELDDFGLTHSGLWMLCETEEAFTHELALLDRARQLGLRGDSVDATGFAAREPEAGAKVHGATHMADDSHLRPYDLLAALRKRLQELGCIYESSSKVHSIEPDIVRTATTIHPCDQVVLATGSFGQGLLKGLGLDLPLISGKGYSMLIPHESLPLRVPALLVDARVAITPMGEVTKVAGTMELGAKEEGVNQARLNGIKKSVSRVFPTAKDALNQVEAVWTGLRPCLPDGLPAIGRLPVNNHVIVAQGHAMLGLSLGAVTGEIVRQIVEGDASPFEMDRLDPNRF